MIRLDANGYILDTNSGDGGDSANRAGLLETLGKVDITDPKRYVIGSLAVRHPVQAPWNNPKNFSRDQLIPLMSGLRAVRDTAGARRIFWSRARHLFFAQNTERDVPGSTKYPWPSYYTDPSGVMQFKAFDFADPLLPDNIWHMILCARLWPLYWFGLLGYPWLVLSIYVQCKYNTSGDDGQIICEALVAGPFFVRLYKRLKPGWEAQVRGYWAVRNMTEIFDAIKYRIGGI